MRIGLNLLYLIPGVVGGTETYARGLLSGFAEVCGGGHEFVVYVNREAMAWAPPLPLRSTVRRCRVRGRYRAGRYAYEQAVLPMLAVADRLDVMHSLGYVMPLLAPCARVVTVHDLNFLALGDTMPTNRRVALRSFVRASVARAHAVVAVSEFTRGELTARMGIPADRIAVTHEAAERPTDVELATEWRPPGATAPYMLVLSSASPHKNVSRLVSVYTRARMAGLVSHDLVVVGHLPPGWTAGGDGLRVLGYLGEAEFERVLRGADALLFPSTYEGFGLPVLEAMIRGVPVACSTAGALPEVAGGAALLFDPFDESAMMEVMARLGEPATRARLREAGLARASAFSWAETARRTLDVYEWVASGRRLDQRGRGEC